MKSALETDLKRLAGLAYHRLEANGKAVRNFHRHRKSLVKHPDFTRLEKIYAWLFVPITLWAVDFLGVYGEASARMLKGARLEKEMRLLVDLLPALPDSKACDATIRHEHQVQRGSYESLIRAPVKFEAMEQQLAEDAIFQDEWQTIKERFDVAMLHNDKQIIRRRLVAERSMREHLAFCWDEKAARFQAVFDVFCQRWNLYGMQGDMPLLLKLTVNLTPFGTMIFVPAYWSFDPKRDLDWRGITALHKARGVAKQGAKLAGNQSAQRRERQRARQLWAQAAELGLKGEKRNAWVVKELGWDPRTDDRKLRRLLKSRGKP